MSDAPHVHRYTASCRWRGSTGAGYAAYDRAHEVEAVPAETTLSLSGDPAFGGDPTFLNPEQLLVMAASSCQLLSLPSPPAPGSTSSTTRIPPRARCPKKTCR
jgi:organic hydroperoxide reductase OsmC/OhrA